MSRELTLYSKPGCHLCEEMKEILNRVRARLPFGLQIVDISDNSELESRYGVEIPVLLIDGRKAAKYRITERELEEKLRRLA